MYPTRPAPPPPVCRGGLPPTHPFATYYVPSPYSYAPSSASSSTASLTDDSAAYPHDPFTSPRERIQTFPTSPSSPFSPSHSTNVSAYNVGLHRSRSPTSSLAEPPTPQRHRPSRPTVSPSIYRAHTSATRGRHPSSIDENGAKSLSLPPDFALVDRHPRENLLGDLEFIMGKRLSFPIISRLVGSKKSKRVSILKEQGQIRMVQQVPEKRVLQKERNHGWEDDFAWEGVHLLPSPPHHAPCTRKHYRGVHEGNWI